ncbi:MAG: sulfite exporter TauE/SafE family protein [Pseudolabrys sp.]|jgi:uncharacterized membrane protein YfcA|nr:sulfite exporter TauE/SafE family protein [Pseudolabrys sp.]
MMETQIISFLLGSFTGIVLALTGAGGAIIAVPLLIFGLHLAVAEAAPIALLAVCLSATIGASLALLQRKVRYRAAGFIALTGAVVSPIGVWLAQKLPNTPLTLLFAMVLMYVAFDMFRQSGSEQTEASVTRSFAAPCLLDSPGGRLIWTWPCVRALALSGLTAGSLSGLLGVGGGFVVVPALKKVTNLEMQAILATSLAVIALIAAIGVTSSAFMGGMNWLIAIPFAGGAIAGMLLGRLFANRFAGPKLQQGFAVLAVCVSVGMVIKVILAAGIF